LNISANRTPEINTEILARAIVVRHVVGVEEKRMILHTNMLEDIH
jgi:hypothetical protein